MTKSCINWLRSCIKYSKKLYNFCIKLVVYFLYFRCCWIYFYRNGALTKHVQSVSNSDKHTKNTSNTWMDFSFSKYTLFAMTIRFHKSQKR